MALSGRGRQKGVTLIPQTLDGLLLAVSFDVTHDMSDSHQGSASTHPVQRGAEGITDALQLNSPLFSCSGLMSDTPVTYLTPAGDRAVELYQAIIDMRATEVPITVICSWRPPLKNAWPVVIDGSRGPDTGAAIDITINFVKFRLVTTQVVPSILDSDVLALGRATLATSF